MILEIGQLGVSRGSRSLCCELGMPRGLILGRNLQVIKLVVDYDGLINAL